MAASNKGRSWQRCRRVFRGVRICVLLLVFVLVAVFGYLNEVGLPDFVKGPLLNRLQARGVYLQFERVRLHWYRGVVAEGVRFGPMGDAAAGPQFRATEVEVRLNHAALAKLQLSVDSLVLHNGRMDWPVAQTNTYLPPISVTNVQAQLRFLPGDQWEIDHFRADLAGVKLRLAASVTNASSVRNWSFFHPSPGAPPGLAEQRLRQISRILEQLQFPSPPDLTVTLQGDARDQESFHGLLTLDAPGAETPWGKLTNGALIVVLRAAGDGAAEPQADVRLRSDVVVTPQAGAGNFDLHLHVTGHETLTNVMQAALEISADSMTSEWAQVTGAHFKLAWTQSPTNPIPVSGVADLHLAGARTKWGSAGAVDLSTRLDNPATNAPRMPDATWGWWAALAPYSLDWNCRLRSVHTEDARVGIFEFKELFSSGGWLGPELTITNAHAELYGGAFDAHAALNVASRELTFDGTSTFDLQKAAPLLTEGGREWLQQYSWTEPPRGRAAGAVVLPEWTNRQPDWRGEILPTLWLQGGLQTAEAAFRGVPVSSAAFHFSYSNMIWNLPDLEAARPEGGLKLEVESDDRTKRFHFHVHSTVDPNAARQLLPPSGQRGLDAFIFTRPPVMDADVWGHWHNPDEIGFDGDVTITNFAVRGESADYFHGHVQYTNGYIVVTDARAERNGGYMTCTGIGIDPAGKKAFVTNGLSTMEPAPFFRTIGPKVTETMSPYQFRQPPTVHANGVIPLSEDIDPADLHFQVDGGPFHWMRFNLDHISGGVDWVGKQVTFTNIQGSFYQGNMAATAAFDFSVPHEGADFSFDIQVADADLHALMTDIFPGTNHLEGRLSGNLDIARANSSDIKSWNGSGEVGLRNGLLWEIPIFGIFSPVLDKFQKGWGESRVDQGTAAFTITNSVIRSDELQFRAPGMQMLYQGTVDFTGRVDATVQARLLGDLPLVGPLLGLALSPFTKLFEYKVTGTLSNPKSEPRYVPNVLMMPFNSFDTLRRMVPGDLLRGTNAPPSSQPFP